MLKELESTTILLLRCQQNFCRLSKQKKTWM